MNDESNKETVERFFDPDKNPIYKEYLNFLKADSLESTDERQHAFFAGTASGLALAKDLYSEDKLAFVEQLGRAIIISATLTGGYTKEQLTGMVDTHRVGMEMLRARRSKEQQP